MRAPLGGEIAGGSRSEAPSPDGEPGGGERDTMAKTLVRAHSLADVVETSVPWTPLSRIPPSGFGHGYCWVDPGSPPLPPPSLSADQYSAVAPNRVWGDGDFTNMDPRQLDVAAFGVGESRPIRSRRRKTISRVSREGRDPEYYKLAHEPFVLPASVEAQFKVMCAAGNFDGKRVDELIR